MTVDAALPDAAPARPGTARRRLPAGLLALPGPLLLLVGAGTATWSVVRYDLRIVAVYTVLAVLLGGWLWRRGAAVRWTPPAAAVVLVVAAALILRVPAFTYLPQQDAAAVRWLLAGGALLAAAGQLVPWRHAADAGLAAAVAGHLAAVALLITGDPAPRIDVWYTLQGAADALVHGGNPYTQVWVGPIGPIPYFTYLPWMAVLLAPGRWVAGDVRWALAVVTVAGALAVRALAGRRERATATATATATTTSTTTATRAGAAMAALLLLLPGTQTQVEQAWTEPVLLATLAGAALALRRGRLLTAALLLALGLASKQHVALLLPVLAAWPRVGPRRVVVAGGIAGLLVAPFFLMNPAAMWHDTITLLVNFPPLKFSDTLYIAALHELDWLPPFWLTGALVLATVVSVSWTVRRRNPGTGELLRWCALVLLVANLLNKQAFYNQYWLILALVVASWAVPPDDADTTAGEHGDAAADRGDAAEVGAAAAQPTG